mmetsp:Transcript_32844/g.72556  ORF Transcript_32844/g.72556 Transcript_32844/m.72556 type:complete len:123 (+) Transcript_32844:182-550(+)|eukprot:CAMPEP_0202916716 /NCGR_PEP_ID=MMETSP1392-20130828/69283_1 /ASSEMBLY_ACC=CAM_ASM_000868 /TAXON_ID=225041 /ORGANISM="Chlamydomonas chlamydogama, Strain SAG 11-48b" /LENGTH=122 /DNA_ID=CAMNT_0049609243 /DNA_START=79 /DNA_END=447 /DNA_ORIENTATION=+
MLRTVFGRGFTTAGKAVDAKEPGGGYLRDGAIALVSILGGCVMNYTYNKHVSMEGKLTTVERQVLVNDKTVTVELGKVNSRLDNVDARLDKIHAKLDNIDARLDRLDSKLDKILDELLEKKK